MFRAWLLSLPCLLWPGVAPALQVPPLTGRVSDLAGMLSPQAESALEALLQAHEDSTTNQVAVLTIPSLEGEDIETFSMRVAEQWKLGQADRDNGVLVLVARDDRQVRIEVGAGLEGDLPDITCGRIIRQQFVPRFREGDYDGGVLSGTSAVVAAVSGAYSAPEGEAYPRSQLSREAVAALLPILMLLLAVALLVHRFRRFGGTAHRQDWAGPFPTGGSRTWLGGGFSSRGFSGGGGSFSGGGASGRW